jgi:hypothetical protein
MRKRSDRGWLVFVAGAIAAFFLVLCLATLLRKRPAGFSMTLIHPMEDTEVYLSFFRETALGEALLRLAIPVFGFHAADAVLLGYWLLAGILGACLLFVFIRLRQGSSTGHPWLAAAASVTFVLLGRKLFSAAGFLTIPTLTSLDAWSQFLRSLAAPHGAWFLRFYQPGLSFLALLSGLVAVERLLGAPRAKVRAPADFISIILLVFCVLTLSRYPWMGLAFSAYLGIELLRHLRTGRAAWIFGAALAVLGVLFLLNLGGMHSDFTSRVQINRSRWPDAPVFQANLFLLLLALPFRRSPVGEATILLQFCNLLACCSSVVVGYSVLPWHYLHVTELTMALLLFCAGEAALKTIKRKPVDLPGGLAGATALFGLLVAAGLREQKIWREPELNMVSAEYVSAVVRAQESCGPGSRAKFFYTTDPALAFGLPGRSLCRNLNHFGWGDRMVTNSQIAATYLASALHFGSYASRDQFMRDLELHIKELGSPLREPSRNQVRFDAKSRFYLHNLDYHFHGLTAHDDPTSRLRELFATVDYSKELSRVRGLDQQGEIWRP